MNGILIKNVSICLCHQNEDGDVVAPACFLTIHNSMVYRSRLEEDLNCFACTLSSYFRITWGRTLNVYLVQPKGCVFMFIKRGITIALQVKGINILLHERGVVCIERRQHMAQCGYSYTNVGAYNIRAWLISTNE